MNFTNNRLSLSNLLSIACLWLGFYSCTDHSKSNQLHVSPIGAPLSLKSNSELKYYFIINTQSDITININDKKIEMNNGAEVGIFYNLRRQSDTSYQLQMTYDTFHIVTKREGLTEELASSPNSYNNVEKLLSSLKGATVNVTVGKQGKIIEIRGKEEIQKKVLSGMRTLDPQAVKNIQNIISKLVGESFIQTTVGENFSFFPDSTLNIGDTWNRKSVTTDEMQYNATTTYTLESVENGIAYVDSKSLIETDPNNKIKMMGFDVSSHLTGEQDGKYEVDEKTGIVMLNQNDLTLKGTLELMGKEAAIKIKLRRTIKGKKASL